MIQKQELIQLIENYSENDTNKALTLLFLTKYDDFWSKKNTVGQITCACWVVNKERTKALMTHHLKLNRWLQLGGHLEAEDNTIVDSCIRELKEESGIYNFKLLREEIFDLDVHPIPESKKGVPAHIHYDIRMVFEADENEPIQFDISESNNITWMSIEEVKQLNNESITRMIRKCETSC
jgi:8-oxo-dGTP pyrophosphatase MutT (NUDIX family)